MDINQNYKESAKMGYELNLKLLEKIKKVKFILDKDEFIFNQIYEFFLFRLKENYQRLKNILEESTMSGYYEVLRSNYELSMLILFVLHDKHLVADKITTYNYCKLRVCKQNLEFNQGEENRKRIIENFKEFGVDQDSIDKDLDILIVHSQQELKKINKKLVNVDFKEIRKEIKKTDNKNQGESKKYPKFYYYFCNNKIKSFRGLCKFLKKLDSYYATYAMTSSIAHGEIYEFRNDPNLLCSTTQESNLLCCEIIKNISEYYCTNSKKTEIEKDIKEILGVNYKYLDKKYNQK